MRILTAALSGTALVTLAAAPALAEGPYFTRIATFPVYETLPEGVDPATETAAEIITATTDGQTLIFTDSPGEALGFIDIADPAAPKSAGRVELGGEPTSVTVVGDVALVGVNTAESFVEPSGHLAVVDITSGDITATCDVKGQPDSVAVSPDGAFVAIAIENERDEDLNDGLIPQLPAGHLAVFDLNDAGMPANCDSVRVVDLTGLAEVAPSDPEPEFVSINGANQAVVTMQENNHLAIVDLASGEVTAHFSAGTASLSGIPTEKARAVDGTGSLTDVRREPDAVAWIDDGRFITADEGDYEGGSRSFTVFAADGTVQYASGALMEHLGMRHGHYPAKRAHKKGSEPEGVAVGSYGDDTLLFVNSERGNFIAVFKDTGGEPESLQFLPTGVGPEGLLAIPGRDLFVVAAEEDSAEDKVRSTVGIYQYGAEAPAYPTLVSADDADTGAPIGWGAISGMAADPDNADVVFAVSDSFYDDARIFTVDVSAKPATITGAVTLTGGDADKYDLEGIAIRSAGGFWVASEGHDKKEMDNRLLAVAEDGTVQEEILLPESLRAEMKRFGFEGVAEFTQDGETKVIVAIQREWNDDPDGQVKLGVYTPASGAWAFVGYPLDAPRSPVGGWVGLSEIVSLGDLRFAVVERDNQGGPNAAIKQVTVISLDGVTPVAHGGDLPVVEKAVVMDLLPLMAASNGWTPDKIESLAITADGTLIAATDNDGVDDATGETMVLYPGTVADLK